MKQYIPQKAHKYGVKIFKLCCEIGYTWNLKIYAGKESDAGCSVPTNVVTTLSKDLLNSGRTIVTDNFYTSIELANILLDKKTHLLGTLRANRSGNPKELTTKKLKKGEVIARENGRGICVLKWRDKRDVLMLSTNNGDEMVMVNRSTGPIQKPQVIIDYNNGKSSIDLSDQLSSYSNALRRTLKWYRKIAIELLLGTTLVNAHFIYTNVTGKKICITEFREKIVEGLLKSQENLELENNKNSEGNLHSGLMRNHRLEKKEGKAKETRRYCRECYRKKQKNEIPKNKVKKVTTYCVDCVNYPHMCLDCFNYKHHK